MMIALLVLAVGASVVYLARGERRRAAAARERDGALPWTPPPHRSPWRVVAQAVGLDDIQESGAMALRKPWLSGRRGDLRLRLERSEEDERIGTLVTVDGLGHGSDGLAVGRRGRSEVAVGDPDFDRGLRVRGRAPLALAVLDAETRAALAGLLLRGELTIPGSGPLKAKASLGGSRLTVWIAGSDLPEGRLADVFTGVLDSVLGLARRLAAPADLPDRIAENLGREPVEGVRARALLLLQNDYPDHPATRGALLAACRDPSPALRLQAAVALGDEGRETLLALALGEAAEDEPAARAIQALGHRFSPEQTEAALRRALAAGRSRTAQACLEALGFQGRAGAEGLLLEALADADPKVAAAAALALGRVGTAAALAPLRAAEAPDWRSALGSAARQAIAEIRARFPALEPGRLSLTGSVESNEGALSLAGEPGGLSLSREPEGPAAPSGGGRERAVEEG